MPKRYPYHEIRSTTILTVRHNGRVAMGGDGQVTMGQPSSKATP